MQQRGNRTRLGALIATCAASAALVSLISLTTTDPVDWSAVAVFAVLAFAAETFAVTTALGSTYSVTFVVTIAAAVAVGPAGAIVASLFGTTGLRDAAHRPPIKHLFNASQIVLSTAAAAYAFHAVAGPIPSVGRALAGVVVAAALNFGCNTGLVSLVISVSAERSVREVWREQYWRLAPAYLAYAILGWLLALLHAAVGWGSLVFFLVPLLVARNAFRAAIELQDAFDRVITTLVAAVEQKDAYTGGHAGRGATLAERVARAYGLPSEEARKIRYAALMHDIGKLAVHNAVLQKDGKLTDLEHEHMRRHPEHGVELARGIELLSGVLDGIRHHHERFDGAGYPDGLAGADIPVAARIITVSDAFDAMTSTRAYRPARSMEQAFAELDRNAGTQFDPRAVAALRRAIAKGGWEPAPECPTPAPIELDDDLRERSHEHSHARVHEHSPDRGTHALR